MNGGFNRKVTDVPEGSFLRFPVAHRFFVRYMAMLWVGFRGIAVRKKNKCLRFGFGMALLQSTGAVKLSRTCVIMRGLTLHPVFPQLG